MAMPGASSADSRAGVPPVPAPEPKPETNIPPQPAPAPRPGEPTPPRPGQPVPREEDVKDSGRVPGTPLELVPLPGPTEASTDTPSPDDELDI